MDIEIITIGNELLLGQIIDTNSVWIAQELIKEGFNVSCKTTIKDSSDDIKNALRSSLKRADIVLLTGGLGPTKDDITKQSLCDFFNTELVFSNDVFNNIKEVLKGRVKSLNSLNRDQALVPNDCTIIQNSVGTAPIMWFEKKGQVVISMPGVPSEMKTSMINDVIPKLKKTFFKKDVYYYKTVNTNGISEANLAEMISDWEESLKGIELAYLPSPGKVRLRLSMKGDSLEEIKKNINGKIEDLKELIGKYIWGYDDETPQSLIGKLLSDKDESLSSAESCTGGKISHLITSIPGSSAYFLGGVCAYHNSVKEGVLEVDSKSLKTFGAVSKEVVEQMAVGVKKRMNTTWSVATSGVAGPGGGSKEKPVGTVWIAWAGPNGVISRKFTFGRDREYNITRATETAMVGLLKLISG